MGYLDEEPKKKLFTPKEVYPHKIECVCFRCRERNSEWQNEGHTPITEDFSGDKTPQERLDEHTL